MLPLFHCFGFFALAKGVAVARTLVFIKWFDFETMLMAVDKYRVTNIPVSLPGTLALTKNYEISSLRVDRSPKRLLERYKFPIVQIWRIEN